MASIETFLGDDFSVTALAAAINLMPKPQHRIAALNLFSEEGITTTTAQIEYDGQVIGLVAAQARGGVGHVVDLAPRKMIPFNTVHLPQRSHMLADEVQNVRAFGSETELEVAVNRVKSYQEKHKRQLDLTHEFQRLGAIKGKILDADGTSVLLDVYSAFGIQQKKASMALSTANTDVRSKCDSVIELIVKELDGALVSGAVALCGQNFWTKLISHKSVRETYLNTTQAAELRGKPTDSFDFGGITFERYRGQIGGTQFIDPEKAYAFPVDVADLFITRYAPADYMDTVNTTGLPYYSIVEPLPLRKGLVIESQSNPLHIPTRPNAIIELTAD